MSKNLLIVGAGVGFARATARRFGADGWTVHLIARSQEGLERLRSSLEDEGVRCLAYPGDVCDHGALSALVADIDDVHPIDAMVFQPRGADDIVDVLDVTVDNVRSHLDMLVLGAVAAAAPLVSRMVERYSGALIFIGGGSARLPLRFFGNLGPAMSGLRNYAMTLNTAVRDQGVYSGFYTVAGAIGTDGAVNSGELDPVSLADRVFTLVRDRDAKEVLMTPDGEVAVKASR